MLARCLKRYSDLLEHSAASLAPSTPVNTENTSCAGITFHWSAGSPYLTYPFAIHDPSHRDPGYEIISIDPTASTLHVRSRACSGTIPSHQYSSCRPCHTSTTYLTTLLSQSMRVVDANTRLRHNTASNWQLTEKLKIWTKALEKERLKVISVNRDKGRLRTHLDTWKELYTLMGSNDVPALHRIIRNGVRFSWGVDMMLKKVKAAIDGTYHAKNFSQLEMDLATVVYELGGGAVLHALHNSPFAFPSRNTLSGVRSECRLRISVGEVRMEDILHNIEVMFKPDEFADPPAPPPDIVGMTLCLDEVASDGRLCWVPETDDVAGLCEHASGLPTTKMGIDLTAMGDIFDAIREDKVHIGQEILVVALARNDSRDYGAKPVLILPTCKRGSFEDAALLLEKIRQAWRISEYGECRHGRVWSIASDGDPKRRPALFLHCNTREITPQDTIFEHVGFLPGICKLLCTREGILVNNVSINKDVLATWLERLTDVDWSEDSIFHLVNPTFSSSQQVEALLSPKDAQDVPRAIKLLSLMGDIPKIDRDGMNPSEIQTHSALSILGEMLEALVEPFINPEFTISQQITSLSKFAFLLCAIFLQHNTSFMPSHLYSDLQCMVRTAIFRVAHTKILDPERQVLLCELGDDCLEVLFGCVRMIGGHAPNVSPDVFCHRVGAAVRLRRIFEIYRHWEMKARRLMLKRTRDADHLSPRNWKSELRAISCDLLKCWIDGMEQAMATLTRYGCDSIDFRAYFRNWRITGYDLLRPRGGRYPGISAEIDRSLVEESSESATSDGNDIDLQSSQYAFRTYDGKAALAREMQSRNRQAVQAFIDSWIQSFDSATIQQKQTVSSDVTSTLQLALPASGILSINSSLFAALISTDRNSVSLCIMHCTLIKHKSRYLHSAPVDEIILRNSSYEIGGQILELLPFSDIPTDEDTLESQETLVHNRPDLFWLWTSRYISLEKLAKKATPTPTTSLAARTANLQFVINGRHIYPLTNGECTQLDHHKKPHLFFQHSPFMLEKLQKFERTWCLTDGAMVRIQDALLKRCLEEEDTRSKLLVTGAIRTGQFPYCVSTFQVGELCIIGSLRYHSTDVCPPPNGPLPCNICGKEVEPQERQNHMGHHILFSQHGIPPNPQHSGAVSAIFPCGFCGQSMANGSCSVREEKGKIVSSCTYAHPLLTSRAIQSTASRPCSNCPIPCKLNGCGETHWKYNMMRHLADRHPNYPALLEQNPAFRDKIQISVEEQERMGLMDATMQSAGQRLRSQDGYDSRRSGQLPSTQDLHGASPRRTRHYANTGTRPSESMPSLTYHANTLHTMSLHSIPLTPSTTDASNADVFS
ncbi:hypothetical protein DFP72DRAFT_815971 [Ephemerocybe angulata]|uniref:Uncharacterized protein n=1 Tax=Ephemerocybe angulata TaxID=980116 RepID=A0A8H6HS80_9AGAR|nr:hypothetical protein DFP72DRAFT_815971 [Tulosesus angulatus]